MMELQRRDFLRLSAAGAAATMMPPVALANTAFTGRVTSGGKGLAGVIVSDGLQCVKTKADGTFSLPYREGARFVTASVPSGYRLDGYSRAVDPSVSSYDFAFEKSEFSGGKGCRFLQITDSEINNDGEATQNWIRRVAEIAADGKCAFIVHTGDICYLKGMQAHLKLMTTATMGVPTFYCVGNHDLLEGDYGEQVFERMFGPSWFSFDAGGIHFLVVPMIDCWDHKPKYTEDELADWLRNDLALVDRKRPVMVFSHMLFHPTSERECGLVIGKERPLNLKSVCNFKGFVYGHTHTTYTSRNDGVMFMCASCPAWGGIDHSPSVIRVFDVKSDGSFVTENHYGLNRARTWTTSREGAVWERALPSPVLFCTPVVHKGMVYVGTTDDENRHTGLVVAFDAKSGAIVWKRKVFNSIKNRLVVAGGNVIAQDAGGHVYAFSAAGGKNAWNLHLYHYHCLSSAVAASPDGETVYVGIGKRLCAVDARTGKVKWRNTGWDCIYIAEAPGIGEGKMVWAANWDGLECNDLATGEHLWSLTGAPWRFPGPDPLIVDGKAIVVADMQIGEVDLKTGKPIRVKDVKEFVALPSGPILTTEKSYIFGSVNGGLLAVDRNSLEVVWHGRVETPSIGVGAYKSGGYQVNTSPVRIDGTTVCAASGDGSIRFWEIATGRETRKIVTGAPYLAGVAVSDGRIFVADMAGKVRAFAI